MKSLIVIIFFILLYRNSGEWRLGSRKEKRFMFAQIFVPLAAFKKQYIQLLTNSSSLTVPSAALEKQPCSNSLFPHLIADRFLSLLTWWALFEMH